MQRRAPPRARSRRRTGCGRAPSASGTSTATCQKCGSSSRAVGPAPSCRPGPRARPARAGRRGEDLPRAALDPLEVGLARDEHVRDGERRVERQLGRVPAVADLLLPDRARDVDHHAAAVALAVHVAGAVEHLLEGDEALLDHVVSGLAVPADRRVERARVLVLDRLRPAQRPVGLGGRVATGCRARARGPRPAGKLRRTSAQSILPGSAPSSSGRATGSWTRNYSPA